MASSFQRSSINITTEMYFQEIHLCYYVTCLNVSKNTNTEIHNPYDKGSNKNIPLVSVLKLQPQTGSSSTQETGIPLRSFLQSSPMASCV